MKIYSFKVYDEPKRGKFYRYGKIKKIIYKDGNEIIGDKNEIWKAGRFPLQEDVEQIKKIVIESHYQKRETEPYPNFMEARWSLECADEQARTFLNKKNIKYRTISLDIINEQKHTYEACIFPVALNLVDLEKSNLYLSEKGFARTIGEKYYMPFMSKTVLKPKSLELKGIYLLREVYKLICDEETKNELEKSGLTGFYFEELEVSGN